jgi:hypothetical protein
MQSYLASPCCFQRPSHPLALSASSSSLGNATTIDGASAKSTDSRYFDMCPGASLICSVLVEDDIMRMRLRERRK